MSWVALRAYEQPLEREWHHYHSISIKSVPQVTQITSYHTILFFEKAMARIEPLLVQYTFVLCSTRQWQGVWSPAAADFKAVDNIRLTLLLITRNAHSWSQIAEKVFWCKWNLRSWWITTGGDLYPWRKNVVILGWDETVSSLDGAASWGREVALTGTCFKQALLAGLSNTSSASLALALELL